MTDQHADTERALDAIEASLRTLIAQYDDARHDNVLTDLHDALLAIRNAREALDLDVLIDGDE
jgi:hypothetical protein